MTMGFGIYEQSLLLLTNASEYVITKSKARELFLHHKTYKVRQNKRNSRKPLYSGHLQTTDTGRLSQAVRYIKVPLYLHIHAIKLNISKRKKKLSKFY